MIAGKLRLCYNTYVTASNLVTERRCIAVEFLLSFIVAVAAGVVCHYIIKWLDGDK